MFETEVKEERFLMWGFIFLLLFVLTYLFKALALPGWIVAGYFLFIRTRSR